MRSDNNLCRKYIIPHRIKTGSGVQFRRRSRRFERGVKGLTGTCIGKKGCQEGCLTVKIWFRRVNSGSLNTQDFLFYLMVSNLTRMNIFIVQI